MGYVSELNEKVFVLRRKKCCVIHVEMYILTITPTMFPTRRNVIHCYFFIISWLYYFIFHETIMNFAKYP